jgi:hypothetical protein
VISLRQRDERGFLRLDPIEADVDADPIEPRRKRRVAFETAQPTIRPDEPVLSEVARVLVATGEAVAELIDLPLMPGDDDVERRAISGKAAPYRPSSFVDFRFLFDIVRACCHSPNARRKSWIS